MQELEEGERKQMAEEEDYMRSYSSLGWLFASKDPEIWEVQS